ncbi:MAG: oxidoreductase, partial [Acidobacteria bacterium]
MDNVINFGGMTALITGASSGIGAASATAFG